MTILNADRIPFKTTNNDACPVTRLSFDKMFTSPDYCKQTRTLLRSESIEGNLYSNLTSESSEEEEQGFNLDPTTTTIVSSDNDDSDDDGDIFDGSQALPWDGQTNVELGNKPVRKQRSSAPASLMSVTHKRSSSTIQQKKGKNVSIDKRNSHHHHRHSSNSTTNSGSINSITQVQDETHHLRPIIGSMAEIVAKGNHSNLSNVKEYLNIKSRAIHRRKTMREQSLDSTATPHKLNFATYQV